MSPHEAIFVKTVFGIIRSSSIASYYLSCPSEEVLKCRNHRVGNERAFISMESCIHVVFIVLGHAPMIYGLS